MHESASKVICFLRIFGAIRFFEKFRYFLFSYSFFTVLQIQNLNNTIKYDQVVLEHPV